METKKLAVAGLFINAIFLMFLGAIAVLLFLSGPKFNAPAELPELLISVSEIETLREIAKLLLSLNDEFAVEFTHILWSFISVFTVMTLMSGVVFWLIYKSQSLRKS